MQKKLRIIWGIFIASFIAILTLGIRVSYAECSQVINEKIQKMIDDNRIKYQIPGIEVSISCSKESASRDFVSGTAVLDWTVYCNSLKTDA